MKFPKVFLKRAVSEIRIHFYNELLLEAWEANIDVQFILDGYACAAYIVSYISKSQRGMSSLMHEACEEARHGNMSLQQQVRQIGHRFLTHFQFCAQEPAYLVLQMPLRSSSRTVVLINTNEPRKRTFLLKQVEKNSTNIESDNWIKRYKKKTTPLRTCCLADFISKFDIILQAKEKTSSYNTDVLLEDEMEEIREDNILHGEKDVAIF